MQMNMKSSSASTASLEIKLRELKQESLVISEHLTSSLSNSASGQILLQLAKTLDSNKVVPNAHEVIANECLIPLRDNVLNFNQKCSKEWAEMYDMVIDTRIKARRHNTVRLARERFVELEAAEEILKNISISFGSPIQLNDDESSDIEDLCISVERVAFTVLDLSEELKNCVAMASTSLAQSSLVNKRYDSMKQGALQLKVAFSLPNNLLDEPLPPDNERAQFFMKLASRIRKLESDLSQILTEFFSAILSLIDSRHKNESSTKVAEEDKLLLCVGHCLRSFTVIGRGKDAESTFARISIMPLIRMKMSVGRIDDGGARGQCAGLFSLLDDITHSIVSKYGPIIQLAEDLNSFSSRGEVKIPDIDLITGGVWIPFVTALMNDTSIKLSIFSPGIADVIQANYIALDTFLMELAERLLTSTSSKYLEYIQLRILQHPITNEFYRKWNLPIYYQLRFGDACRRLDQAISAVEREGWHTPVPSSDKNEEDTKCEVEFNTALFTELYNILLSFWRQDVFLRPLTHRFLRAIIQLVNRVLDFVKSGLDIRSNKPYRSSTGNVDEPSKHFLTWCDRYEDIAIVAWDLNLIQSSLKCNYVNNIVSLVAPDENKKRVCDLTTETNQNELRTIITEIFYQISNEISPLVELGWSTISELLTESCSAPLTAVKGVAATYRMTNRPPPTQASPYVSTILRPIKEFERELVNKVPEQIGSNWKIDIISKVADKYCIAVQEMITTVKQTEVALRKRKNKRMAATGMTDGEKVMLQIRLDVNGFKKCVEDLGVDTSTISGITMCIEQLVKPE